MPLKKILLASPNYWTSPFQVGSHHLARGFARLGWEVAYLSDAISPWHLAAGRTPALRERYDIYRSGGRYECDGRLWTYLPAALCTPHGQPVLRSEFVHRHWHRWTWPNVAAKVRAQGFGSVDLLYLDSVHQSFWLDVLDYRQSVYRVADYNPQFAKYTAATRQLEQETAARVDLVLYPSPQLKGYAEDLGARRCLYLPNGVDYDHFIGPAPLPPEYRALPRPIAVYLGVLPVWFHFGWLRQAAKRLPGMSFVLIGPAELARQELAGLKNVHVLGFRDYATVPSYLQHADLGLMPFDVERDPRTVAALNPQKLYAYLACGLPVVAAEWPALAELNPPVYRCATAAAFIEALQQAASERGNPEARRRYAAGFAWTSRVHALLNALDRLHDTTLPKSA